MNAYFSLDDKIYDICQKYPEVIDFLVSNGFEKIKNDAMQKTIGRTISLQTALKSRHLDIDIFEEKLVEIIKENNTENKSDEVDMLTMSGVLPCPIRVQLLETLENWLKEKNFKINYELQAASMGLDWLREKMTENDGENSLSDIYLSAGFSLFFDNEVMEKHLQNNVFSDLTGVQRFNSDFDNDYINLKDPNGQYTIIGVVPAIFMVNTQLLGERKMPESWSDLLKPEFANSLAIPMQDLDMFNAILLGLYKEYGEDGIKKLGKNLLSSMHPAQMVKTGSKTQTEDTPVITIMPYFFTWMAKEDGPMKAVWPKDGAIISPIFLLTKNKSKDRIKPLVDFLFSSEMGEVLSANGKFPSTQPQVNNALNKEQKFIWPGWDFIYNNDIAKLLKKLEDIFFGAI